MHWQHSLIAICPGERGMIFSSSAVVDWKDTAGFGGHTLVVLWM
jgi:fructan beta-fructosidase